MGGDPDGAWKGTLAQLIAAGDIDAAAGFYDAHAPSVLQYCAEICPAELIDEATLAAFVDFRGRLLSAPPDADLDQLLARATRVAAASRMDVPDAQHPECRLLPELVAARLNGETRHGEHTVNAHARSCRACQRTVERLAGAEDAMVRAPTVEPPSHVRAAWLELAALAGPPPGNAQAPSTPVHARRRSGGIVGAARRFTVPTRRR
jgi:hypothetical protein